jgi:hypothetical protein
MLAIEKLMLASRRRPIAGVAKATVPLIPPKSDTHVGKIPRNSVLSAGRISVSRKAGVQARRRTDRQAKQKHFRRGISVRFASREEYLKDQRRS